MTVNPVNAAAPSGSARLPLGRGEAAGIWRGNTARTRNLLPLRLLGPLDRTPLVEVVQMLRDCKYQTYCVCSSPPKFPDRKLRESLQTVFHNQESASPRPSSCSGPEQSPCANPTADYRRAGLWAAGSGTFVSLPSPLLQTFPPHHESHIPSADHRGVKLQPILTQLPAQTFTIIRASLRKFITTKCKQKRGTHVR